MHILLHAPPDSMEARADQLLLEQRGYKVLPSAMMATTAYARNCGSVPSPALAHYHLVLEIMGGHRTLVIHPDTTVHTIAELKELCQALRVPLLRLCDLDICAASMTAAHIATANVAPLKTYVVELPNAWAPTRLQNGTTQLRERLVALHAWLLRWERRVNAFFGDGLKNPMVREQMQQREQRPYRINTTISTTG